MSSRPATAATTATPRTERTAWRGRTEPATRAPSPSGCAAGAREAQASVAASRPVIAATTIDTVPRCSLIASDSAATCTSTTNTRASAPNAPIRESRIAVSARSWPAPKPSATSASPSRCRPRVSNARVAIPMTAGSRFWGVGSGTFVKSRKPSTTRAVMTPRTRPTSGANAMARPMVRRSRSRGPRTGSTDSRAKIVRVSAVTSRPGWGCRPGPCPTCRRPCRRPCRPPCR